MILRIGLYIYAYIQNSFSPEVGHHAMLTFAFGSDGHTALSLVLAPSNETTQRAASTDAVERSFYETAKRADTCNSIESSFLKTSQRAHAINAVKLPLLQTSQRTGASDLVERSLVRILSDTGVVVLAVEHLLTLQLNTSFMQTTQRATRFDAVEVTLLKASKCA